MTVPVTVVVPHQASRVKFFKDAVLPAIGRNRPAQLIIIDREGDANSKRNEGAAQATQPYLFFCDDDCILMDDCLETMYRALEEDPKAAYAYSDFKRVVHEGSSCPYAPGVQEAGIWTEDKLKAYNFVDTASLMRRDVFPGFDPEIKKFQDWDLWLTILEKRGVGVYIPQTLFELHYIDRGISKVESHLRWRNLILRKHRIYGKDVWPTVSFIVGTNGEEGLEETLHSFGPLLLAGDEGIVLTNGPIPQVRELAESIASVGLKVHEIPKSDSFEWDHRNQGMKLATSEYIAFLDDRTILLNGALPAIRRGIARFPGKALIFRIERGRFVLPRDGHLWHGDPVPTALVLPNEPKRWPLWTQDPKDFFNEVYKDKVVKPEGVIARCQNGEA